MSKLVIEGGVPLCGVVEIQGAKNSILPIMAATLLSDGECEIDNFPDIGDTHIALDILRALEAKTTIHMNSIVVNASTAQGIEIPDELMRKMRSSLMFLGAILSKNGRARVSLPGGCDIGTRPVDLHIGALKEMGVSFSEVHGFMECEAKKITPANIILTYPSVGATENIMLAASKADGVTTIKNAAKEPEIVDLQNFINAMGGKIRGAGSDEIIISGVKKLHGVKYSVIPDRIVLSTYMCAVAATRGNAVFKKVNTLHVSAVLSALAKAGCKIRDFGDTVALECDRLRGLNSLMSMPYPGFPTDAGSPFVAMMTGAEGTTLFVETIFENRFRYVGELLRMGAKIKTEGRAAVIEGQKKLYGAPVEACDLRGGAALVVAALAAEGTTVVSRAEFIERGYEKMDSVLSELGARIKYEKDV